MVIEELLKLSIQEHASDLHLYPGLPPLLRIDGDLVHAKDMAPLTKEQAKELVYTLLLPEEQKIFEEDRVLDLSVSFPDIGNFRVNALHQLRGVAAVIRIVPEKVPSFDELKLPPIFKKLLMKSHGLILIAGPTGSGKTTTLAALVDYINTMKSDHIITIEDPIEFTYTNKKSAITQLQVGRDTPDIATALSYALRQDPDVIMVGEMRDVKSARLALSAAETGHLVLASLHASSAPLAISRVIDLFPNEERNRARSMLSETLHAITCQTLVKKLSGGRAAAFEIMIATPSIRHMIAQDANAVHMESAIQTGGDAGMYTLTQSLQDMVNKGIISSGTFRLVSSLREALDVPMRKD